MQMYKGTKSCYVISLSSMSCDPKNYDIISSPEKNKVVLESVQNVVWYDLQHLDMCLGDSKTMLTRRGR